MQDDILRVYTDSVTGYFSEVLLSMPEQVAEGRRDGIATAVVCSQSGQLHTTVLTACTRLLCAPPDCSFMALWCSPAGRRCCGQLHNCAACMQQS
jgi:hypothetical protein